MSKHRTKLPPLNLPPATVEAAIAPRPSPREIGAHVQLALGRDDAVIVTLPDGTQRGVADFASLLRLLRDDYRRKLPPAPVEPKRWVPSDYIKLEPGAGKLHKSDPRAAHYAAQRAREVEREKKHYELQATLKSLGL